MELSWDNELTANSEAGTIAYIKSKTAGGTGITILSQEIVPEPLTFLAVLAGLASLATYVRRRTVERVE